MTQLYTKRFKELENQLTPHIVISLGFLGCGTTGNSSSVASDFLLNWSVKAKNIIANSCGEDSQHYKAFEKSEEFHIGDSNSSVLRRLAAVFLAAKEDFEGGFVKSIRSIIQAEVFDDELEQSSELLRTGYITAAAVIAGTVLESTLRGLCVKNGLPTGKLDKMNSDLAKIGIHNSLLQKKITAIAGIRNSAAHGKIGEFTSTDVESMIADVRSYLERHI